MSPEITVQILLGNISFSFKTNESGAGIDEAITSIRRIIRKYGSELSSLESKEKHRDIAVPAVSPPVLSLNELKIEQALEHNIVANIRKVSYWNLILALLYHAPRALTYDDIMSISTELRKP